MTGDRYVPASAGQQRICFLQQLWPSQATYVLQAGIEMDGPLDTPALAAALADLIRRHDALRTTFPGGGTTRHQQVSSNVALHLEHADLSALSPTAREARFRELAYEQGLRPFALASAPLVRFLLVRRPRVPADERRAVRQRRGTAGAPGPRRRRAAWSRARPTPRPSPAPCAPAPPARIAPRSRWSTALWCAPDCCAALPTTPRLSWRSTTSRPTAGR